MLNKDLINNIIPRLKPRDTVAKALQLVTDFQVTHLPVVNEQKFLGLISEADLLDTVEDPELVTLDLLREHYVLASVNDQTHFLGAVNISIQLDTNVVPVTRENNEYLGCITTQDLLKQLGNFAGANEIGGIIVLQMERPQFHISEISRIVESNDCTILHLNTTQDSLTGLLTVTLHINKREISTLVATFERYEYDVVYSNGYEEFENEVNSNYDLLMKYLDI